MKLFIAALNLHREKITARLGALSRVSSIGQKTWVKITVTSESIRDGNIGK